MPIFVVSTDQDDKIAPVIASVYKNAHNHPWPGVWFIVDEATSREVGQKLSIDDGSKGQVFITALTGAYWGWGPKNSWEWLTVKGKPKE